jgi:hypothetical protein
VAETTRTAAVHGRRNAASSIGISVRARVK